jgi:hypothetical protein
MRERSTSYESLAAAIGCSPVTAKVNLQRRQPASRPVQAGLRAWLAETLAPEVAAPAVPFRDGRRRNGSDATASPTAA